MSSTDRVVHQPAGDGKFPLENDSEEEVSEDDDSKAPA